MKVYKSKISYGLLSGILLLLFAICILEIFSTESIKSILMAIAILVLTAIFIIHLFFSTKYMIVDDIIKIRSGVIYKKDLEIKKILSISKSSTLISSPAASFDRIELKYGQFSSVVISPKDKISFIEELIKINPNINNQIK